MAQVVRYVSDELAFFQLDRDTGYVEQPQYMPKLSYVICRKLINYNNVVHIVEGNMQPYLGKDSVHFPLEGFKGVLPHENHPESLKSPVWM